MTCMTETAPTAYPAPAIIARTRQLLARLLMGPFVHQPRLDLETLSEHLRRDMGLDGQKRW